MNTSRRAAPSSDKNSPLARPESSISKASSGAAEAVTRKPDPVPASSAEESKSDSQSEFARLAAQAPPSLAAEFLDFLVHNKKWWLTPIVIVLLLFGLLIVLAGTPAAPFIYTLF